MKVLVAEDDRNARLLLTAHLHAWGYESAEAADGSSTWTMLQAPDAPRILLLDWMMPAPDGLEICRRLRAHQKEHYTYIVMITSCDDSEDAVKALEAGADDFITKPFNPTRLRAHLRVAERLLQYERMSLESDRQAAMAQHLAAIALLSAGIAHEINQPLNALTIMQANLQRMLDRDPSLPHATIAEKLADMNRQVKRIAQITSQMRAMTSLRHKPELMPVNLNKAVGNVIKMIGSGPAERHIIIKHDRPPDLPEVRANAIQMEQVIFNLINNAVQTLEKRGRGGVIDISARREGNAVILQVADDGPGFPGTGPIDLDRIMAGDPAGPRMGIGLKLVKKFVADWSADIAAVNRAEGGALISIRMASA